MAVCTDCAAIKQSTEQKLNLSTCSVVDIGRKSMEECFDGRQIVDAAASCKRSLFVCLLLCGSPELLDCTAREEH